jgi:hypothetical protein
MKVFLHLMVLAAGFCKPHYKCTKTSKHVKEGTGLQQNELYILETSILRRLRDTPSPCGAIHVQQWLSQHDNNRTITTAWAGRTLDDERARTEFCSLPLASSLTQAMCIDEHLHVARVRHGDPHGKNMAIENKILTLIDFDIATLDGLPRFTLEAYNIATKRVANTVRFVVLYYQKFCAY